MARLTLVDVDLAAIWRHVHALPQWRKLAEDIADAAMLHWDQLTRSSMSPASARAYRAGITKVSTPGVVALVLAGVFPLMLERGWAPGGIDLRQTLLRPGQRGVKTSSRGFRYRHVMFRHDTGTGTGARYAGARPGDAETRLGRPDAQATRTAVLNAARRLRGHLGGGNYAPGRGPTRLPDMTPVVGKLRDRHTTSIYTGMRRGARGTGMRTWRTISNNPRTIRADADGTNWWHPGIRGRHLVPKVSQWVDANAPRLIAALRARL